MANPLLTNLRKNSSEPEFFTPDATTISYKSGYPVLDYMLAYEVPVVVNDEIIDRYINMGIPSGCFVTVIGKTGTSKTTLLCQIATNIVRPFNAGTVMHLDLEQAWNYSRVAEVTGMPMSEIEDKYVLRQGRVAIGDIFKTIKLLAKEKMSSKEYDYDTGRKNEFGEPIIIKQPTVVLIDSIAAMVGEMNDESNAKKEKEKSENISTQADRMRLTGEIARFYTEALPYLRAANIIVLTINHIKPKSGMSATPTPSEMLYLKNDEICPGGKAPQFYAHILLKIVNIGSEKKTIDEDGYHGVGLACNIVKSRVSKSGTTLPLFFDSGYGVDPIRSTLAYLKDEGLTGGNKNKTYFGDNKDLHFSLVNVHEEFDNRPELYKAMYEIAGTKLKENIRPVDEFKVFKAESMDY